MNLPITYREFLEAKVVFAPEGGFAVAIEDINPLLKDHQKAIVQWACAGGRRAIFAAFGLGKSFMQLELLRLVGNHIGEPVLQVAPLGLGNLLDAGDPESGSVGIRLQLGPTASSLSNVLCDVLKVDAGKLGSAVDPLCQVLKSVLPNIPSNIGANLINIPSVGGAGTQAPATNLGDLMLRRQK